MNSEEKFWLLTWAIIATVILGITAGIVGYNVQRDRFMAQGIAAGGDPIRVRCAYDTIVVDADTVCLSLTILEEVKK